MSDPTDYPSSKKAKRKLLSGSASCEKATPDCVQTLFPPPAFASLIPGSSRTVLEAQHSESQRAEPIACTSKQFGTNFPHGPGVIDVQDAAAATYQVQVDMPNVCHSSGSEALKQDPLSNLPSVLEQICSVHRQHQTFSFYCPPKIVPVGTDKGPPLDTSLFFIDCRLPQQQQQPPPPPPSQLPSSPPPTPSQSSTPAREEQQKNEGVSTPLFEGSPLTANDCMVSILTYALKSHLSGKSTCELIKLLEVILPQPNTLPKSAYLFKKYFKDDGNELQMYYFCTHCWRSRMSSDDICTECTAPNRKVSYFLSCSLDQQLKRLYSRPGFSELLTYKYLRKKQSDENIEDIYDSEVYKEQVNTGILNNPNNISLTWYSDGISVFECSTYSLWPCIYIINELPPEERYKPENILIGGLWGGDGKPHPNIFLLPLYHEIKKVNEGVLVNPYGTDTDIIVRAVLICGTCDIPAKSNFMNMKGHAGYFSCSKCFIKGEKSERTDNVMVFPHQEVLELRTDDNYLECVREGTHSKDGFKGVFGPSLLFYMFSSPFISGMCVDGMHSVYMGVTKQILKLLFDVKFKGKPFSLYDKISKVNDRLHALNLPHFVQRLLLEVDKNLSYWKASLCRNFLLYIVLIVLKDILPNTYFVNLCNLVNGVSLLNSSSISREDLNRADILLSMFCRDFQRLYGVRHMSLNIHSLRHLARCVEETGNLFHLACFRFEDLNGQICRLVHGTRHVLSQISSHLKLLTDLPLLIDSVQSELAKKYCSHLMRRSKNFITTEKICDRVYVVGNLYDSVAHSKIVHECSTVLFGKSCQFLCFDRLYKHGVLYVSSMYERGSRVSSFCKYSGSLHGNILTFVKLFIDNDVRYFALIERSNDLPVETGLDRYVIFSFMDDHDLIPVSQLLCVTFCLSLDGNEYLIDPLNSLELE